MQRKLWKKVSCWWKKALEMGWLLVTVKIFWNTELVSSGVSLTSWGEGASLALVGHFSGDAVTIKIPCGVEKCVLNTHKWALEMGGWLVTVKMFKVLTYIYNVLKNIILSNLKIYWSFIEVRYKISWAMIWEIVSFLSLMI